MNKYIFIIFFFTSLFCVYFYAENSVFAAESPENVGEFFESLEGRQGQNSAPSLEGEETVQSLPGREITQEEMQNAFPQPLRQDAPSMDFIPNAAPLFPALPLSSPQESNGQTIDKKNMQNETGDDNPHTFSAPFVPTPQEAPALELSPTKQNKQHMKPLVEQDATITNNNEIFKSGFEQNAKKVVQKHSIDNPSLEMMVGQMIMAGFTGGELEKESAILKLIQNGKVGGVYLQPAPEQKNNASATINNAKQENIYSPSQLKVLTATLQGHVPSGALPLFIATEQEGGLVQSLRKDLGFSGLAAAAHLGKGSVEQTEIAARSAGLEMAGLGVNFALAPAGDVNLNPLSEDIGKRFRSFGVSTKQVAAHVMAFGKGLEAAKVLPCLRNFPGTGSRMGGFATQPSNAGGQNILYSIPDIGSNWRSLELEPYSKAVQGGWQGAIQPALVYHRVFDSLHPVPLSVTLLQGVLRARMGFDGIIISQDLRALQPIYSLEDAVVQSVLAGVDILLISEPAHLQSSKGGILPFLSEGGLGEGLAGGLEGLEGLDAASLSPDILTKQLLTQSLGKAMPGMGFGGTLEQKIQTGHADEAVKVYNILLNAARTGRIPMENIRASWRRIKHSKKDFLGIK